MTARERLHRDALRQLASLSPDAALRWLDRHGPPAGDDREEGRSLSDPLQQLVRRRRQQTLAANLHRIARFQELVDKLSTLGIPVCPLKGIHLLGTVYRGDPENRPMCDMDVLVRREDSDGAIAALEGSLGLEETSLSRRLAARSHERVLVGKALVVEIHTRLGLRTGRAGSWEDLSPAPSRLHDREVHILDRDTTLAYSILHFVQHTPWSRLVWVEDILRWSQRGFDPEVLQQRAQSLGCRRLLTAGVRALRDRLGSEVLPGVPGRDRGLGRLFSSLYSALSPPPAEIGLALELPKWPGPRVRRHLGTLLLADRLGDLLQFFWARRRHRNAVSGDS